MKMLQLDVVALNSLKLIVSYLEGRIQKANVGEIPEKIAPLKRRLGS